MNSAFFQDTTCSQAVQSSFEHNYFFTVIASSGSRSSSTVAIVLERFLEQF